MKTSRRRVEDGNKQGDEEGEWTYIGSRGGGAVIDYGIVNEEDGNSRRIQKSRVGPSRNSFEEAKERERIEKENGGG
jgi:hypothetical protein